MNEAIIAVMLERRYSKRQIIEFYANEVYLGQAGQAGIYGFGEAARYYFGKDVGRLTVGEAALFAGLVRAPNVYNPAKDPKRAKARRDVVLTREELRGLEQELLLSHAPPLGREAVTRWVQEHGERLGRAYANDLDRHFRDGRQEPVPASL